MSHSRHVEYSLRYDNQGHIQDAVPSGYEEDRRDSGHVSEYELDNGPVWSTEDIRLAKLKKNEEEKTERRQQEIKEELEREAREDPENFFLRIMAL